MRERSIGPDDLDQVPVEQVDIGGEPSEAIGAVFIAEVLLLWWWL